MKRPPTRASADASSPSTQTTMPGNPGILEKRLSRATFAEVLVFFFITKNYLSALIIAFFQVASYAATAPSLPVTTALSATLSVSMSPSSAAEVQARRQKEADPKRLQLNNHKPRNLLPHGLYPPLLLRLTPSRNTNSNHLPRSYALIPPFFPSITSVTAFIPPAYPQTILHPPTRV